MLRKRFVWLLVLAAVMLVVAGAVGSVPCLQSFPRI